MSLKFQPISVISDAEVIYHFQDETISANAYNAQIQMLS